MSEDKFHKIKELNRKQAKLLCKDIENQEVKRYGLYKIGKYCVMVGTEKSLLNITKPKGTATKNIAKNSKTDYYYKLHPDKRKDYNKSRNELYVKRKLAGLCVKCGKKAFSGLQCKHHRRLQEKYNEKRRKK